MTFKAIHAGSIMELAEKTWITMKESKSVTKDPICGMTVDEATALHAERDGKTFYFCSDHRRQKFLSTPTGTKPEGKSGCAAAAAWESRSRRSERHEFDLQGLYRKIATHLSPPASSRAGRRSPRLM